MPLYQGIRRGLNSAIGMLAQDPYGQGQQRGANLLTADARIRELAAQTESQEFANQQRQGLAQTLAGVEIPGGFTPEQAAAIFTSSDNPNANQFGQLFSALDAYARRGRAEEAADPTMTNKLIGIGAGKQIEPYAVSSKGIVLNKATGAVDAGNPMAQGNLGLMDLLAQKYAAQTGQAQAAAGRSGAAASLIQAKIQQLREGLLVDGPDNPNPQPKTTGGFGTPSADILKLYQKVDADGKPIFDAFDKPVLDQDEIAAADAYGDKQGITNINDKLISYKSRELPEGDAEMVEQIDRSDARYPPVTEEPGMIEQTFRKLLNSVTPSTEPETPFAGYGGAEQALTPPPTPPAAQGAVAPADIGLNPQTQPAPPVEPTATGVIPGAGTPKAIPINGIMHEVIGVEPGGGLRIRNPQTGQEGIYTDDGTPQGQPLSDAGAAPGRRITGTYAGQPFDFTIG